MQILLLIYVRLKSYDKIQQIFEDYLQSLQRRVLREDVIRQFSDVIAPERPVTNPKHTRVRKESQVQKYKD